MLNETIADRRGWTKATIDDSRSWYYPLSDGGRAALERAVSEADDRLRPMTAAKLPATARAACAEGLRPVIDALETGRGFAIITGVPVESLSERDAQLFYWLLGQLLGTPFEQNVQGTLLYDVRDTGQYVSQGARFSVTNAESTFHTDNSFGQEVLDYVGLLCIHTAKEGGINQIISGYTVHNRMRNERPAELRTLYEPFHIDRRGGVRPGEAPTIQLPVFQSDGQQLTLRYLRHWIEAGHEKAGVPLTEAQRRALDALDEVLKRPELPAHFGLKRGEVLFVNNRWIFHNRTAFEDYSEPERRRHLVRLWLKAGAAQGRTTTV